MIDTLRERLMGETMEAPELLTCDEDSAVVAPVLLLRSGTVKLLILLADKCGSSAGARSEG